MAVRIISGAILVVIALVTILAGGPVLAATLFLISLVAFSELCKATGIHEQGKRVNALEMAGYFAVTIYYGILFFARNVLEGEVFQICLFMTVIITLMAMMFIYVFTFPNYQASQIMSAFFSFVYAPVMLSCIALTRSLPYGIYLVWMIFISSWICDTCAYFAGVTLGKHKLTPKLSPKKSVEGAVGGVLGSAAVGALFGYFMVEHVISEQQVTWVFALISAIGACISQVGDLAASGIKRNHNIKDYGKLIPGHGGIMDRFDSVIFTAPMVYLLSVLFFK